MKELAATTGQASILLIEPEWNVNMLANSSIMHRTCLLIEPGWNVNHD